MENLAQTDRLLVWSYSDTDEYTLETCDWYTQDSFGRLKFEVAQVLEDQLDTLYGILSEWFNLAEYPDLAEQLLSTETSVFLNAVGAPADTPSISFSDYDCFRGLCAVIRHRVEQQSLEQIKLAADLFNWTIDFGLDMCDEKAFAVIKVGSIQDVAPFLLNRILNRLPEELRTQDTVSSMPASRFDQEFLALRPVLKMLRETVESSDWIRNQLAIRMFCWVVDTYKGVIEASCS